LTAASSLFYNTTANIVATGYNITADYFIGDGSLLTGLTNISTATVNHSNSTDYWDDLDSPSEITGLDSSNIASLNLSLIANSDYSCPADTYMYQFNGSLESISCQAVGVSGIIASNLTVSANNTWSIGNETGSLANVFSEAYYQGGSLLSALYCQLTGCTMTGNLIVNNNITVENIFLETDNTNHRIYDNSTCIIITGDTTTFNIC
jgi:hypothetical protein